MSFPVTVIFAHPDAGYQGDQDHARQCGLVPGQVYQLRSMQVGQSDTMLELHGMKDERFSSVLFEPYEEPDDDPPGEITTGETTMRMNPPALALSELTLSAVQAAATGERPMAATNFNDERLPILTGKHGRVAEALNDERTGALADDNVTLIRALISEAAAALAWAEELDSPPAALDPDPACRRVCQREGRS